MSSNRPLPLTSKSFSCPKCPHLTYPKNTNGFPFSGNRNLPGSLVAPGIRCAIKIRTINRREFSLKHIQPNHFGSIEGAPYGFGAPPRNAF